MARKKTFAKKNMQLKDEVTDERQTIASSRLVGFRFRGTATIRKMWKHVVNPGSIKCDCGKVVSSNKAWDHVQGCEVAQEAFKKATELVKERTRRAKELEENDNQSIAGGNPNSEAEANGSDDKAIQSVGEQQGSEPGSIQS